MIQEKFINWNLTPTPKVFSKDKTLKNLCLFSTSVILLLLCKHVHLYSLLFRFQKTNYGYQVIKGKTDKLRYWD